MTQLSRQKKYKRVATLGFAVWIAVTGAASAYATSQASLDAILDNLMAQEDASSNSQTQSANPVVPSSVPAINFPTNAGESSIDLPVQSAVPPSKVVKKPEMICVPASEFQSKIQSESVVSAPVSSKNNTLRTLQSVPNKSTSDEMDIIFSSLVEQTRDDASKAVKRTPKVLKKAKKPIVSKVRSATRAPARRGDGTVGSFSENASRVVRLDDTDGGSIRGTTGEMVLDGKFQRVGPEPDDGTTKTVVEYYYLSRGAWLVDALSKPFDQLAVAVKRQPTADLLGGFIEVTRSYAFLSSVIATDDGSEKSRISIAEAVNAHRQTIATIKALWPNPSQEIEDLLIEYIQITFLEKIEEAPVRIPVGAKNDSRFESQPRDEETVKIPGKSILNNIFNKK